MSIAVRLLGNFPVSQVAGCRCTLLAENSFISLAGSEEQINFSSNPPKSLKWLPKTNSLLLFLDLFCQKFPLIHGWEKSNTSSY